MGTYRAVVTIHSPVLGGVGTNTWHFRTTGDDPPLDDSHGDIMAMVETFYTTMQYYGTTGTEWRWDGLSSGVGTDEGIYSNSDAWTVDGLSTTNALPPANAVVINWRGQSGDRSRRGRTFFGPLCTQPLDTNGTIKTDDLAVMRGAAAALVEDSDSFGNGALGIWSRQEDIFRDFVASSVTDQFAVLTSRRD